MNLKTRASTIVAILLALGCATTRAPAAVQIEDDLYVVNVEPADGSFTVAFKPSGKIFLTAGKLTDTGGTATTADVADKIFGAGKALEIVYPNGNRETAALYPGLPFVLFRSILHNAQAEPIVLNHVPGVSAGVDLGKPDAHIVTLGTGGLLSPAKNPGSYTFLAVANPQTRSGVVSGWLTQDRGSGVVFSPTEGDAVRIQARLDYGRLRIKPGQDVSAELFAIGYFDDARLGLEAYADAIAKIYAIHLPPHLPGYCTWYAEKHRHAGDEKSIVELSEYAARNLKPFGFGFIQIDEGWEDGTSTNGPKKNFTIHDPKGPYPSGMKATAENISRLGLVPGLWFIPFAGTWDDPYFKDHQDWFARGPDGKPFDTQWGGTCLDMTHPGAREHVRDVVTRISHDWGYQVFKLDAFWTGAAVQKHYPSDAYVDDNIGETSFFNPDQTNIEALRDGVKLVRAAAGPGIFLLGCNTGQNVRTLGGSFGLLDAMRVGPDTGALKIGAPHATRVWFLNGRVWWNDPDCVAVRAKLPLGRARLNASFVAIAGDLFYNSDWMPDFPPERLDIFRRCIPSHDLPSRPVDVFENEPARIWHLPDTRGAQRRDVVALYNWDRKPATIACPVERIGLPPAKEYVGFDFWANQFIPAFKDEIRSELPPESCRILAVRPVSDHPQLLSTSRHITQGMIDVTDEQWDAAGTTLSGKSKLVANDAYELRIAMPAGWRATKVGHVAGDEAAKVETAYQQDGPWLRVTLTSPTSRQIEWNVQFADK